MESATLGADRKPFDLPDALDVATYTAETNCLIIDNSDSQASGFCDINEVHIFNPLEKKILKSSRSEKQ